jgi:hypothetical protein
MTNYPSSFSAHTMKATYRVFAIDHQRVRYLADGLGINTNDTLRTIMRAFLNRPEAAVKADLLRIGVYPILDRRGESRLGSDRPKDIGS